MKEDLEEQNKKLIEEIESLKNLENKDDKNKIIENNINNLKEKNNSINNNEEMLNQIQELKKIIEDYKTGKIIPENAKKCMNVIKDEKLSDIEDLKKKFEAISIKNKNYESKIKYLNDNIAKNIKNKKDLENIILKQENKITELNSLLRKKDSQIQSKEIAINKNEVYSLQLMNIIKEQKFQIQNIKKQKKVEDISQIAEFKRQINNLENSLEIKDSTIENMKKTHKNLQDKYIKLCFNLKKQEQDILLNQAILLKKQKINRDALKSQNKYATKLVVSNSSFPKLTEDGLSEIEYPNLKTNSNINSLSMEKEKKEIINKNRNDIFLPSISNNNTNKNEENMNIDKDNLVGEEWNKLDEINEQMKKVIEEN